MEKLPKTEEGKEKVFWPEKDEFFKVRETFIFKRLGEVEDLLKEKGFEEKYIKQMVHIILRAYHVAFYMLDHAPIIKTSKIKMNLSTGMSKNMRGTTTPIFSFLGRDVYTKEALKEIIDNDQIKHLLLSKVLVSLNIDWLKDKVEYCEHFRERFLKQYGEENRQEIDKDTEKTLEELAVQLESTAIEEVAHAFYFISVKENNQAFEKAIKELINYNPEPKQEGFGPDDSKYTDTDVEKHASFWQRSYLKKYYPKSETYYTETRIREKQKERINQKSETK